MTEELNKIDTYPVLVEPFHVDFTGRIFMGILGNHLLNVAGKHSQKRGWGISTLNESHYTWVLSRLSIEMLKMPHQYQKIEIRTWVESVIKLFTNRNFVILDQEGKPMGYARSIWAMIDLQTRKPCNLYSLYDGDILRYIVSPEENVCPIEGHGRFRFHEAEKKRTIQACYSDVDINGHVNSMKYIDHILDLIPTEYFSKSQIRRLEVAYKSESYLNDSLDFYVQQPSDRVFEVEVKKNDGPVVCQSRIVFQ